MADPTGCCILNAGSRISHDNIMQGKLARGWGWIPPEWKARGLSDEEEIRILLHVLYGRHVESNLQDASLVRYCYTATQYWSEKAVLGGK
jgi:hypothetical protein